MTDENIKAHEIKRLTTPLTIKNSKAYDDGGKLLNCCETLSDVRFIVEPNGDILTDNEIIQYAPESKRAAEIRLSRGAGDFSDVLLINESLPWVSAFYYVVLFCVSVLVFYGGNKILMFILLILSILPLVYIYNKFNLGKYEKNNTVKVTGYSKPVQNNTVNKTGIESLNVYQKEVNNLKVLFEVKEGVVRDLVAKRFEPPQITYDKFISIIDSSHDIFYKQVEAALNIINLASEDTPRVKNEIESKIESMKQIINQIEELTNELVININDDKTTEEVKNLIGEMEDLIESVKEY